ncbi:DUF2357 domain-containing protein [Oribacterium sp. FC2011]|uniref:DUF2357 domain-containing protein n=1 Tax=Oribacterium sp. FC2011 TaxID=1408311 RepID=UPI0004E2434C|nr:DUF2357 domain-containing protein [Oribacterium sp. FC2011]
MISPRSGSNQIIDVTASDIRVTIKRRKISSLSSDTLLEQSSKMEVWGKIEKLSIGGNDCCGSINGDYIFQETTPLFFEQSDYIVTARSINGTPLHFEHADKYIREAITPDDEEPDRLSGVINFGNKVGYSNLVFFDDLGNRILIEIEVFPSKLSYKDDYESIRNDINDMVEAAAIDFINSTYSLGTISSTRNDVPAIFFTLISQLFKKYHKATKVIMQKPNHKLFKEHVVVPNHKLKQNDINTVLWLSKHSEQIKRNDGKLLVNSALGVHKKVTYDTVENRLVKFMLSTTLKRLIRFKRMYLSSFKEPEKSADYEVLRSIEEMVAKINEQLKNPIFSEVSSIKNINTMSLVFQMAPGYRDLYRYFQLIQRGISFSGEVYSFSIKETSTLYEYWCFIKLVNIMKKRYALLDDSKDIIKANRKGVTVTLSKDRRSEVKFLDTNTGDTFELIYNPGEYPSDTVKQVPDNVLKLSKRSGINGKPSGFQYVFDAKYKVEINPDEHYPDKEKKPGPKVEDINTMHRYRDAIVAKDGDFSKKLMFGAFVLFPYPNDEDEYRSHQFYKSIESVNIGGVPFLPGKTQIAEELLTKLVGESDESAFERTILPVGVEERLEKVDWTKEDVLVGSLSKREQWEECFAKNYYYVPIDSLKSGYHQVQYIAIYQSKKLFGEDAGVLYYGEVSETSVVARKDINSLGGRTHPNAECYRFAIKKWMKLSSKIEFEKEWVYRPRYSNSFLLYNSKSTYELFNIRSETDYRLVYELRRIQENLRVQDNPNELFVKISDSVSVFNDESYIRVYDSGTEMLRRPTSEFKKSPSVVFDCIRDCILK